MKAVSILLAVIGSAAAIAASTAGKSYYDFSANQISQQQNTNQNIAKSNLKIENNQKKLKNNLSKINLLEEVIKKSQINIEENEKNIIAIKAEISNLKSSISETEKLIKIDEENLTKNFSSTWEQTKIQEFQAAQESFNAKTQTFNDKKMTFEKLKAKYDKKTTVFNDHILKSNQLKESALKIQKRFIDSFVTLNSEGFSNNNFQCQNYENINDQNISEINNSLLLSKLLECKIDEYKEHNKGIELLFVSKFEKTNFTNKETTFNESKSTYESDTKEHNSTDAFKYFEYQKNYKNALKEIANKKNQLSNINIEISSREKNIIWIEKKIKLEENSKEENNKKIIELKDKNKITNEEINKNKKIISDQQEKIDTLKKNNPSFTEWISS